MPSVPWTDNKYEGVALKRIIRILNRQLRPLAAKEKLTDKELVKVMRIAYCMKDLAIAKANIAKTHDLDQRITRLEDAAQIAHSTPPIEQ